MPMTVPFFPCGFDATSGVRLSPGLKYSAGSDDLFIPAISPAWLARGGSQVSTFDSGGKLLIQHMIRQI
jgi:hypothetical protein